jgi:hypothetical protein
VPVKSGLVQAALTTFDNNNMLIIKITFFILFPFDEVGAASLCDFP